MMDAIRDVLILANCWDGHFSQLCSFWFWLSLISVFAAEVAENIISKYKNSEKKIKSEHDELFECQKKYKISYI
jgi:hypothetical protein